jgi:LacI family transcriptional regulator
LFVHQSVKPHCSVQERQAGYRAAMAEAGLAAQECLRAAEEDAVDILVRSQERPTAVICYSNLEATLIVHAMWQFGVSIPGQLSVIGFNEIFATRYMTPPLTTVGFDAAKIGEYGAQLVLSELNAPAEAKKPTVLTVKPRLVVRSSTGPVTHKEAPSFSQGVSELMTL